MNKFFLANAVTAAIVATAIVPTASADTIVVNQLNTDNTFMMDMRSNDTHYRGFDALSSLGVVNGYADETFRPQVQLKRGHAVKMLGKWLQRQGYSIPSDYKTVARFTDVLPTQPDQELVKYAALVYDAGIFMGNQDKLQPKDNMRRDHMAIILTRAIKTIYKEDIIATTKSAQFKSNITDIATLPTDKKEAIEALDYVNITNVKAYKPSNTVTRGQFSTFIYNTIEAQQTDTIHIGDFIESYTSGLPIDTAPKRLAEVKQSMVPWATLREVSERSLRYKTDKAFSKRNIITEFIVGKERVAFIMGGLDGRTLLEYNLNNFMFTYYVSKPKYTDEELFEIRQISREIEKYHAHIIFK